MNLWKVNIYNLSFLSFRKLAAMPPNSLAFLSQKAKLT